MAQPLIAWRNAIGDAKTAKSLDLLTPIHKVLYNNHISED